MLELERTVDAFKRLGISRTRGYSLILSGEFPQPISRFERPSRVPKHEVDAVLEALIAGATSAEIKWIVAQCREQRASLYTASATNRLLLSTCSDMLGSSV